MKLTITSRASSMVGGAESYWDFSVGGFRNDVIIMPDLMRQILKPKWCESY